MTITALSQNKSRSWVLLYSAAIACCLLLSGLEFASQHLMNYDATLYLRAAHAYLNRGYGDAAQIYSWPFYSIIIAWVAKGLGIRVMLAAVFVTLVMQLFAVISFVCAVGKLSGDRLAQWLAIPILLVVPAWADYRDYLIRDFGFWGFLLYSHCLFLSCYQEPRLWKGLAWGLAVGFSCLFRLEGLLLFVTMPAAVLVYPEQTITRRLKSTGFIASLGVVVIGGLIVAHWVMPYRFWQFGRFSELVSAWYTGKQAAVTSFQQALTAVQTHGVTEQAHKSIKLILIIGMIGYFFIKLIKILTPINALLAYWGAKHGELREGYGPLMLGTSLAFTTVLAYFISNYFFLSARYVFSLALTFLLLAPIGFAYLIKRAKSSASKLPRLLCVLMILGQLAFFVDAYYSIHSGKAYITQSKAWLTQTIQPQDRVLTNVYQMMYYLKQDEGDWQHATQAQFEQVPLTQWPAFDVVVFRVRDAGDWQRLRQATQLGYQPQRLFTKKASPALKKLSEQHKLALLPHLVTSQDAIPIQGVFVYQFDRSPND